MSGILRSDSTCQNKAKIMNDEIAFEALCSSYGLLEIRVKGVRRDTAW